VAVTYAAVKSNRDLVVRQFLASLGVGFNCSSKQDVQELLTISHNPALITYTHPYKTKAFLAYAALHGVKKLTVESTLELALIREYHPNAELLLRLATFQNVQNESRQSEFGLHPAESREFLLAVKASQLNLVGVAFHVEADGSNPSVFQEALVRSVETSRVVFEQAKELGFHMNQLDLGGGFRGQYFEDIARALTDSLDRNFRTGCQILAEPGRFLVSSAVTKACRVIGKRLVPKSNGDLCHMLYLNDSIYDNFSIIIHDTKTLIPCVVHAPHDCDPRSPQPGQALQKYTVCGSTTNVSDRMCEDCYLPGNIGIDDWLYFSDMGGTKATYAAIE